jgi:transcriptional regulator
MYLPRCFNETRIEVMHALVDAHPLGALVRHAANGLEADHIPFEFAGPSAGAPYGVLRGHVARANPLWRDAGAKVMVLFHGPSAYVPPEFLEEKTQGGKVVPTWNYAVVHAHGPLQAHEDPAWLLPMLERLTARHEAGRANPWKVSDAPREYIDRMLKAIVGIEIPVERLEGKWKLAQDESLVDQAGIAAGLASSDGSASLARLMRERLAP